jgi:hypothetical protein
MDGESPPRAGNEPTACGLSSTNGRESGSKLPNRKYRVTDFRSIGTAAIDAQLLSYLFALESVCYVYGKDRLLAHHSAIAWKHFRRLGTFRNDARRFAYWERVHACADRLQVLERGAK